MVGQSGQHKDWYIPVFGSRISSTWTNMPPDQRYVAVDSGAEQDSVAGKSAVAAVATACPFKLKSLSLEQPSRYMGLIRSLNPHSGPNTLFLPSGLWLPKLLLWRHPAVRTGGDTTEAYKPNKLC